jgi:hypothetical protein
MRSSRNLLAAVAAVAGCATGMKIDSVSTPGEAQRAAAYRTYAWLPQPATPDANHNPILEAKVRQAVDRDLSVKGYRRADSGTPDFLVGWHASTQTKADVQTVDAYYGLGWGFVVPQTYVREYQQGTLIIDIVDGATRTLVWRGSAQADLGSNPSSGDTVKKVDEAAGKILDRFPPKS